MPWNGCVNKSRLSLNTRDVHAWMCCKKQIDCIGYGEKHRHNDPLHAEDRRHCDCAVVGRGECGSETNARW